VRPHRIRGGAKPSTGAVAPVYLGLGVNAAGWAYYAQEQPFRDLVQMGNGFHVRGAADDYSAHVAIDANGWPDADFRFRPPSLAVNSTPTGTIYCRFSGKTTAGASDFVWVAGTGFTLNTGSWTYDSGTNTTTFSIDFVNNGTDQNWSFELRNTHKTNVEAEGTGIADFQMSRPPYTLSDLASGYFTSEFKAQYGRYRYVRHLHSSGGWTNNYTTDWSTRPTLVNTRAGVSYCNPSAPSTDYGYPLEHFIALSNECNNDLYINIPMYATDNYVTNMMALIAATLNPGKTIIYELGNECWNAFGGNCYNSMMVQASAASKSIYGTYENSPNINTFNQAVTRASDGKLTFTFPLGHPYTNGDLIYPIEFIGIAYATPTTVTVNSSTSITVPSTITGATTLTATPNWRASGPLTNDLRYDATLAVDPIYDFFSLRYRWVAKRTKEISALIRTAVGDAEFVARHRVILADQMSNGGYVARSLDYLEKKFTAHPVSYYLNATAGAPYVMPKPYITGQGDAYNTAGTLDQFVTAYQDGCTLGAKLDYCFESRAMQARRFGIKAMTYEHGLEGRWDTASSAQRNIIVRAGFDSRIRDYIRDYVIDFWRLGGSDVMWYQAGISALAGDNSLACFDLRTTRTDETTAKVSATNELITTSYPAQGRLTVPGIIDIRSHVNNFAPLYGGETAPLVARQTYGSECSANMLEYATWCDAPGTYTLTVNYGCWQAIRTFTLWHNNVQLGAVVSGPQTNSNGPGHFENPVNVTRSVTLVQGWNDLRIKIGPDDTSYPGEYGFWAMSVA
jgi:hypothetical protein